MNVHADSLTYLLVFQRELTACVQVLDIMVANSIPQGQVKAGDKVVNDVKLTDIPADRFDGQLRPYSQADVEKLRYSTLLFSAHHCLHVLRNQKL